MFKDRLFHMRGQRIRGAWVLAAMGLMGCATAHVARNPSALTTYDSEPATIAELPLTQAAATGARITLGDSGTLRVNFATSAIYPNLRLVSATPRNWEADGGTTLLLDVTNATNAAIPMGMRVDDGFLPDGDFIAASTSVPPGDHRVLLRLSNVSPDEPYVRPTHEPSVRPGVIVLHPRTGSRFDLTHVTSVTVYLAHPTAATTLTIRRFERVSEAPVLGFALASR